MVAVPRDLMHHIVDIDPPVSVDIGESRTDLLDGLADIVRDNCIDRRCIGLVLALAVRSGKGIVIIAVSCINNTWRLKRFQGRAAMMRRVVAVAALIGIVVMGGVHAHAGFPVGQIIEAEGEFHESLDTKRIFIGDVSPHMEALANTHLDLLNLNIGINFGDNGRHDFVQSGTDDADAAMGQHIGQRESKIVRQWVRKYIRGCTKNNLIGGRIAVIEEHDAGLEADACCAVLRDNSVENDGQICTALQLCNNLLPVSDLAIYPHGNFEIFNVFGHCARNILHCSCRTASLGNRVLHVISLVVGDLAHGPNRLAQLPALPAEYKQLQAAYGDEKPSKPYYRRIGIRLLLTVLSVLSGFCFSLLGWKYFYDKRRIAGAALVACGWLLGGGGLYLWWAAAFSRPRLIW